ncbi:UDP-4-amino-4,6-dideoxy-N-acetyl-beta-L-altrosami ne transaminase [Moorella sp. E308F]|uniref:UDP-4-amino-4, 6-dideoxy-N-acetyl-beta-L-altrosamine transaminase n=1 Tax=unclassified Neomoorella TaxID=2676739 RepID=UPI0010FFC120|nr:MULTISPECIES: UDP-4-amino-4,6-dideoxy-N-acetyl-beta-L-altrosamine transaminase [unclassified Moorella (in: firmicutes)]GEA16627.1 UDP-4-amino-4,6-dideoxy-N-acetyl-beta-L-altrosami ne transaminase [Moorella sp. E308F]GEA17184.1 UDP-4-amino-4,6-dideoxy-N-acetyl-beta-L-altrosami ne transaminase [Moorella sp. E306M]
MKDGLQQFDGTKVNDGKLQGDRFLPYARHWVDAQDIEAVLEVLSSEWLTTGPMVGRFEEAVADFVGAREAVAVSSGTAALHAAMYALGIGPGDEVIVPPMTFAATANCVVFQGGTPVFADVNPETLLLDPEQVRAKITPRTKAVIAVDYAGQPCDYDALRQVCDKYGLALVADACHALGATYKGRKVGTLADLTVFSFHPAKHITTGEGGMIVTSDAAMARRMRIFRNHGITADHHQRATRGTWYYEVVDLGYNYRITDFQCALGISQLRKLPAWLARRRELARQYDEALAAIQGVSPLKVRPEVSHAYHLYVVRLDREYLRVERAGVFRALRERGIGVNVHYIPVHLHPFYREKFGTGPGLCPVAEAAYEEILSLPLFPQMIEDDVNTVVRCLVEVINKRAGEKVECE